MVGYESGRNDHKVGALRHVRTDVSIGSSVRAAMALLATTAINRLLTNAKKGSIALMEINVTGRKMNVGDALTTHVTNRLENIADKHFSRTIDATITFIKEGHLCRTDISFHANQGVNFQSRGETEDPYASFEEAAEKIEKQLRRYKRRLKNHNKQPGHEAVMELARDITIAPENDESETAQNDAVEDQPIIIAENRREIPNVSVGDAAMLMDLADANAFMFRNTKSDILEVVYRRGDGNIGWISPGGS